MQKMSFFEWKSAQMWSPVPRAIRCLGETISKNLLPESEMRNGTPHPYTSKQGACCLGLKKTEKMTQVLGWRTLYHSKYVTVPDRSVQNNAVFQKQEK